MRGRRRGFGVRRGCVELGGFGEMAIGFGFLFFSRGEECLGRGLGSRIILIWIGYDRVNLVGRRRNLMCYFLSYFNFLSIVSGIKKIL